MDCGWVMVAGCFRLEGNRSALGLLILSGVVVGLILLLRLMDKVF